ncbi:hypothetical protein SK128_000860 [Halocaridina rubra]|uniref:Uncharacterized protein n=1 Tax=Halocaridina rubra TaxID=373956 RepID=A0AAN8X221_HALRR
MQYVNKEFERYLIPLHAIYNKDMGGSDSIHIHKTNFASLKTIVSDVRIEQTPKPAKIHIYDIGLNETVISEGMQRPGDTALKIKEGFPTKHYDETGENALEETEEAWKEETARRFRERNLFLKEKCASYGDEMPKTVQKKLLNAYYYSKKYDFVACLSAKCGASTWKTHLLHMNGYNKVFENPHTSFLERKIVAL